MPKVVNLGTWDRKNNVYYMPDPRITHIFPHIFSGYQVPGTRERKYLYPQLLPNVEPQSALEV
jgi:hypothetical protein